MLSLTALLGRQQYKCYYCATQMITDCENGHPQQATLEHLLDKWSSPNHTKIEDDSNRVAACYTCNNKRGNIRNLISRRYYQQLAADKNMNIKAASTSSKYLFKLFGAVPQELFTHNSEYSIITT